MRTTAIVPMCLLALSAAGCRGTQAGSAVKVVGGEPVTEDDPVMQSIVKIEGEADGQGLVCTGSLIAPRYVVTAGHCILINNRKTKISFGVVDRNDALSEQVRHIAAWANHEDYAGEPRVKNDLAVITLDEDAPDGFTPIKMMPRDGALAIGDEVKIAGYGAERGDYRGFSGVLNKVKIKISSLSASGKTIGVKSPGKSACRGDSGGPLIANAGGYARLVGVTSYGADACDGETIYTDLRYYQDWLAEHME